MNVGTDDLSRNPSRRPVGGIYTVIKTKAPVTCQEYGDRYTLIGPLSYKSAPMEVEAIEWDKPAPIGEGEREDSVALYNSRKGR